MRTPFSPEILQAGTVRGLILIILAAVGRDFFFFFFSCGSENA